MEDDEDLEPAQEVRCRRCQDVVGEEPETDKLELSRLVICSCGYVFEVAIGPA